MLGIELMQQLMLPIIPQGTTVINGQVSVDNRNDEWFYFLGGIPIYSHQADNKKLFRLHTSQLINAGSCRATDIITTFGVSKSSVMRSLRQLREKGADSFFEPRPSRKGGPIFTPDVLQQAQQYLDQGMKSNEAANKLSIRADTFRKAISDGRLKKSLRYLIAPNDGSTKSARDIIDASTAESLGTACTRVEERTLAALGEQENGASIEFESCLDVPKGGVLCALPALLSNGLLNDIEQHLGKLTGYYQTFHILLLLAFMGLCRIKNAEQLREHAPGEFGKLLGLDRVPEVRCLRTKVKGLAEQESVESWAAYLSRQWMESEPEAAGTLYIDGHVRVYHGHLTKLPKRHVSREKLCLRGITDYWVNDGTGRPFFVVEKTVDPGLLKTLEQNIVPRLLKDIPNQPSAQELKQNKWACRFILVFDREGYSPGFFRKMWNKYRIACMTYHKFPGEDWPHEIFSSQDVTLPSGEKITMKLAELGSLVGAGKQAMWMREVRKLTDSGHQTSIITTAYELELTAVSGRMFSRWCQENFFRYMKHHYGLDMLQEYGLTPLSDTEKVVNPDRRQQEGQRNSIQSKLNYRLARFAAMELHPVEKKDEMEDLKYKKWERKRAELLEEIEHYENTLKIIKEKLSQTSKHITLQELNDEDRFEQLLPGKKRLIDTVNMIAYRAETALAALLTSSTIDFPMARQLLQTLFMTEADILPNKEKKQLRVRVHSTSRPASNRAIVKLFEHLNQTELSYPGTNLRLIYELTSSTKK